MSYYDQQIDLQNVAPGQVAVLKLSYNATYDKIHLLLGGGLTKAMVHQIEGKVNGVQFFVDDGSLLGLRDAYESIFVDPNIITLDFTESNIRGGAAAQYLASLPRNLVQSLTFEITLDAAAPAGITMKAEAEYRDPTTNPYVLRRKKFNAPLAQVGDNDLLLPVDAAGGLIKRIWIHHQGNVTKAELRTNGTPRIRASNTSIQYAQKRNRVVPQNNIMVLDFIADGNLMGMLNTQGVKECLLRLTTSAADSVAAYIDYVAPLSNLH
ncbi:MAG: major capsid protein P2 [Terriglobales bacterium]